MKTVLLSSYVSVGKACSLSKVFLNPPTLLRWKSRILADIFLIADKTNNRTETFSNSESDYSLDPL